MTRTDQGSFSRITAVIVVISMLAVSLSGCATVRRKFVRKKAVKNASDEFIPVLQPQEYVKIEALPADIYKDHYVMAKAYFKDIWAALGDPSSGEKRQRYIFSELIVRLQGMAAQLPVDKKEGLEKIIVRVQDVVKEYDKAAGLRRYDLMKMDLRKIERDIREGYGLEAVKDLWADAT